MNCVETFEKVFTDEIVDFLVVMSNTYATHQNHTLNVSRSEMKVYIAILFLTGYMTPKYMRMFLEQKNDVHIKSVAEAMRRNRFTEIHQYLHTCNNHDLPEGDKFAKVAKYFDLLNDSYRRNYELILTNDVSIDETMIPYSL